MPHGIFARTKKRSLMMPEGVSITPLGGSLLRDRRIMGPMLEIKSYFRAKRRDLYAEKMKFCSLENAPFYNTDIHCHVGIVHEKGHPLAMDCCPSTYTVLVCSLSLNLEDCVSQK